MRRLNPLLAARQVPDIYEVAEAAAARLRVVPALHEFTVYDDEPNDITDLQSIVVGPNDPGTDYQQALRSGNADYQLVATVIVGAEGQFEEARQSTRRLLGELISPFGPIVAALQCKGANLPGGRDALSLMTNDYVVALSHGAPQNFSRNRAFYRLCQVRFCALAQPPDGRDPNAHTQG